MHFVLASCEPDDYPAAVVGVASPLYKSGLLQPIEYPGECPGGEPHKIGKLASGSFTCTLQEIHDLHVRDGHPDPSRRRPEEGRTQSSALPELMRKFPEDLRSVFSENHLTIFVPPCMIHLTCFSR